jgi:hypothetical protein
MKKLSIIAVVILATAWIIPNTCEAKVKRDPGGLPAFAVGCCWGIRVGTEWNEGADLHWREWLRIVPYVNIVIAIWDGIDASSGITAHDWAERNAANWY